MMYLFFLFKVLATVKNQVEQLASTRKDFSEMITAAQHWLLARESIMAAGNTTPTWILLQVMFLISSTHEEYRCTVVLQNGENSTETM